ncbi:MAG TPA: GTPase HflX [Miltoncostaeaceae bacterium]|nr:GTPase HflX [Miltoncostaeaceae bacterium]
MGRDRYLDHKKERELQRTYRGRAERDEREQPLPRVGPERAVVTGSYPRAGEDASDSLAEMIELLRTARAEVVAQLTQHRHDPDPRTYLGKGKLEELRELVHQVEPDVVAVDGELSAGQQRHLEDRLQVRVVDRTAVILDIFALHATTAEGKLQVELAQLEYSYSRQEGLWQHLERLGGGVGTRGPGESQLESDRRMVRDRMGLLRRRLRAVARSREVMRGRRLESGVPRVALAGYTNAGKSSLMNALAGAEVPVDDALFETLDATTRAIERRGHRILLSDTVGFIRGLPHQLVEAFRSTLEEVRDADLVLHVADASEPEHRRLAQARAVEDVLEEIGAGAIPRLLVLNKADLLDAEERAALRGRHPRALLVSARSAEGLEALRDRLADVARARLTPVDLIIPHDDGATLSAVYAHGREIHQEPVDGGTRVTALLPPATAARLVSPTAAP